MGDLSELFAALAGEHWSVALLAVALLVATAVNERTSGLGAEQLRQLEAERPRLAGLIYLCRGGGVVLHWLARGVLLLVAPGLARSWLGAGGGAGADAGGGGAS
jgi:hypothetical protein